MEFYYFFEEIHIKSMQGHNGNLQALLLLIQTCWKDEDNLEFKDFNLWQSQSNFSTSNHG